MVGKKLYVVSRLMWDNVKVRENGFPIDKWVPHVEAAKYGDFEFVHSCAGFHIHLERALY